MNPTAKQEKAAQRHIEKVYEGKTAPRKPISEAKWTPPAGPGPSDNKGIDKALADLMKPNKPRG